MDSVIMQCSVSFAAIVVLARVGTGPRIIEISKFNFKAMDVQTPVV